MKRRIGGRVSATEFIEVRSFHGCIACWKCVGVCPRNVLGKVEVLWHRHAKIIAPENCIGCGKCVSACPEYIFTLKK